MGLIKPGPYEAKIVDYGIGSTKAGNPQVAIVFQFEDDTTVRHRLTWYGHFTEKTLERTIDSLLICGMRGDDPRVLAGGPESGTLDMETEVSIVVEHEKDEEGHIRAKIRWINRAGGSSFRKMPQEDVKRKLPDLRGMVKMRRKETGMKNEPKSVAPPYEAPPFDDTPDFDPNFDQSVGF
jgi:hypothetical protein